LLAADFTPGEDGPMKLLAEDLKLLDGFLPFGFNSYVMG
jgi:hypothetical protein